MSGTSPGAVLVTLKIFFFVMYVFFVSAVPDLNGDFTNTELKRRRGAAYGAEGAGQNHYIIIWTGIKWEGYDSLGLVKLWLRFYVHSLQGSHVLHLSREFRPSDVHEVCF